MRDFCSSLEVYSFSGSFSFALNFASLSQKSLLNRVVSSYLTLGEYIPVHLLVPFHPLQLLKAFECGFEAPPITRWANLLANFRLFLLRLNVLDGLVSSLHKKRPQYKKHLAAVEETCLA